MTLEGRLVSRTRTPLMDSVQCTICPKSYSTDVEQNHLRCHLDHTFRCRVCWEENAFCISPFVFTTLSEARAHIRDVHSCQEEASAIICPKDVRSMQCLICDSFILSQGTMSLASHMRQVHDMPRREDAKTVAMKARLGCRICDFTTSNADTWEHHFRDAYLTCCRTQPVEERDGAAPPPKRLRAAESPPGRPNTPTTSLTSGGDARSFSEASPVPFSHNLFENQQPVTRISSHSENADRISNNGTSSMVSDGPSFINALQPPPRVLLPYVPTLPPYQALSSTHVQVLLPLLPPQRPSTGPPWLPTRRRSPPQTKSEQFSAGTRENYHCQLCAVKIGGGRQNYIEHFTGRNHLSKLQARPSKSFFHCQICRTRFTFTLEEMVRHLRGPGGHGGDRSPRRRGRSRSSESRKRRLAEVKEGPEAEQTVEGHDEAEYKCAVCDDSRRSLRSLQNHLESVVHCPKLKARFEKGSRSFYCMICKVEVALPSFKEYMLHMVSTLHANELKVRIAEETSKERMAEFNNKMSQTDKAHLDLGNRARSNAHAAKDKPREYCSFCCELVPTDKMVQHHFDNHKPYLYRCEQCPQIFNASEKGIRKHLASSHDHGKYPELLLPKDLAYLICPLCRPTRKFCSSLADKAIEHVQRVHGEDVSGDETIDIPVQCRICNIAFENMEGFAVHPCAVHFQGRKATHLEMFQKVASMSLKQ